METPGGYPFGDMLRGFRTRANLSQTALAEKLGVTRLTISNWEAGNNLPRRRQIKEIADALLLDEDDTSRLIAASLSHTRVPSLSTVDTEEKYVVSPPQSGWNRQRMLQKVSIICIKEGLEKSLYSAALITLGLHEKPDAVTIPWKPIFPEEMKQSVHTWPPGTAIGQVYDDTNAELLILGEAGSGKTTLLLQLTRILLDRAQHDENHPIPVVFNLSSWAVQQLPLSTWLVEELNTKYQVPKKLGQFWVETDQILPLLDGLDEVALSDREACVDAINVYRREHGLVPTVVCSRSADYMVQQNRLLLRGAIIIQPLTDQQIDDYLKRVGDRLEPVRTILHDDPDLRELVTTPLMLNVFTLAYYGRSVEDLQAKGFLNIRQRVFAAYIRRMLQRRESGTHYPQSQIMRWLTWLAQQLARRNQSEFYLERMQMDWLPESWLRWLLPGIIIGLVYGFFFGLIKGMDYALMQGNDQNGRMFTPSRGVIDGLLIGALNALIFGLLNGFIFGVVGQREKEQEGNQAKGNWRRKIINVLEKGPLYGLLFGVLNGLLIWWLVDWPAGLYNGLFISVIYGVLGKLDTEIKSAEVVTWSWRSVRQSVVKFVGGGMLIGFFYGLFTSLYWLLTGLPHVLSVSRFLPCLLFGLSIGLVFGLLGVLIRGLSHDRLDKGDILKPNQGIWNSAKNSVFLGLLCLLLFGLFFGVIYGVILQHVFQLFGVPGGEYGRFFPKGSGLIIGLTYGLAVAAFFWVRYGGTASIQHLLLRILLWRAKYIPWDYPHFLDDMTERLLLRRVGGGYTFINLLLRDYFVSLEASSTFHESVAKSF